MPGAAAVVQKLASLSPVPELPADLDLLREFLNSRSEDAFAEIVRRHGPMVYAVCSRVLGHRHDAEDAFQAAFLVLARKSGSIRGTNLAGWLYGVAVQTARGVRIMRDRRRKHELASCNGPAGARVAEATAHSPEHEELTAILDEEIARLPECYRLPVVLCELQGRSRREAAADLRIAEGTLSSRLAKARRKLSERLSGRGLAISAPILAAMFADHAAARVPADLARTAAAIAANGTTSATAASTADGVVKAMFVSQLKGMAVAAGLFASVLAFGLAGGGAPGANSLAATRDTPVAPVPRPVGEAAELVQQLGSPDFATREAAGKKLRDLGKKAVDPLKAGARDPNPEIAKRSREVLATVRANLLSELAKSFDPTSTTDYDHPVWKHYVSIAGDSRASRELFARIIANKKWLQTLDKAEAGPTAAGHVYRVGVAEMFRDFYNDPAKSPPWPCDRPEEVAYLLFLGSFADIPTTKPEGDEIIPDDPRRLAYLGRGIIRGEEQIIHANGITLGLEGKWLSWQNVPAVAGTNRVFARLLAAWLASHDPASSVVPRGLRMAGREILPFARRITANDFEPKREIPPLATIAALEMVARFGTPADLPLFERYFGDETNAANADLERADGARDYFRPAPVIPTTQMRDVALGLALLLYGRNPADFGFVVRKEAFKEEEGRFLVPVSIQVHLGFETDAGRTAAFNKAKAWLDEQKEKK
jgi:RNA polymerase sigma factor (sigma-70 family)